MAAKLNVGDKVRICSEINERTTGIREEELKELRSCVATITKYHDENNIRLAEDNEFWSWSSDWLEPLCETASLTEAQWDLFTSGKVLVLCPTEESSENFMSDCAGRGLCWGDGDPLTSKAYWNVYKERTTYSHFQLGLSYGSYDWFTKMYPSVSIIIYHCDDSSYKNHQIFIRITDGMVSVVLSKNNEITASIESEYNNSDSLAVIAHNALNRLFPDETFSAFSENVEPETDVESENEWVPKFKVGDIVEVVNEDDWAKPGMRGVVKVETISTDDLCGVDFGAAYTGEGLTLNDALTAETGWWMHEEDLVKIR